MREGCLGGPNERDTQMSGGYRKPNGERGESITRWIRAICRRGKLRQSSFRGSMMIDSTSLILQLALPHGTTVVVFDKGNEGEQTVVRIEFRLLWS